MFYNQVLVGQLYRYFGLGITAGITIVSQICPALSANV